MVIVEVFAVVPRGAIVAARIRSWTSNGIDMRIAATAASHTSPHLQFQLLENQVVARAVRDVERRVGAERPHAEHVVRGPE